MGLLLDNIAQHRKTIDAIVLLDSQVTDVIRRIAGAMEHGARLFLCGNGGSAADCQHIAAEFTGRFVHERRPLAAIALNTDTSVLTCIGNDYSFDDIFSRQLAALGLRGDCLIGISTSGNSRNVIRAVECANELGVHTIGLLGRDGGVLRSLCRQAIVVPGTATARIQEAHILIGHTICGGVEQALGLVPSEDTQA